MRFWLNSCKNRGPVSPQNEGSSDLSQMQNLLFFKEKEGKGEKEWKNANEFYEGGFYK